jgi:rhodanese-related sulfurtransferase
VKARCNELLNIIPKTSMAHSPEFLKLVNDAKSRIAQTTPEEVKAQIDQGGTFILIDTREDNEWDKGRIVGSIHLCKGVIERDIEVKVPDKNKKVILYCGGGFRSALAADNLQKMGYTNVASMDGGWRRWKELGYPMEANPKS